MSPASYRTAPPRVAEASLRVGGGGLKSRWLAQQVERPGDLGPGPVGERGPPSAVALAKGLIGCGEVGLGLPEQRAGLRLVPLARMGVPVARVLLGRWGGGAGHVADRVDEGVADPDPGAVLH